jgi:hypothetical protein
MMHCTGAIRSTTPSSSRKMAEITVFCEFCREKVTGLVGAVKAPTTDGKPVLTTGGFYLTERGAVCDDCHDD